MKTETQVLVEEGKKSEIGGSLPKQGQFLKDKKDGWEGEYMQELPGMGSSEKIRKVER